MAIADREDLGCTAKRYPDISDLLLCCIQAILHKQTLVAICCLLSPRVTDLVLVLGHVCVPFFVSLAVLATWPSYPRCVARGPTMGQVSLKLIMPLQTCRASRNTAI
jgi:hypothetical protein